MLSRKRSIERLQQRITWYESSFDLKEAKKLHLRYRSVKRKKAQDIPTCEEKEGHNIRTQKRKCSIRRWATYVGLLGMPIKRQETKKIHFFKSIQLLYFSSDKTK